ncbi:DUF6538 domain-containing protein [Sedimentimonas flavescens]|uniref:DUF6538 domain-containing protein n=1 Tax=Sedimentimonas flavescens TaxID=2851012 RepID=UPI0035CD0D45
MEAFGRKEVIWSLRTKDPDEAKLRYVEAARKQAMVLAVLRKRPAHFPHQQIVALFEDAESGTQPPPALNRPTDRNRISLRLRSSSKSSNAALY